MIPKLSVVIPVFNEPLWIGRTVAALEVAVENARLTDVELVLVDDGSDYATQDALRALRTPFPSRVLRQDNSGRLLARKTGIEAASGELVLLLDSRVCIQPEALRYMVTEMERTGPLPIWNAHTEYDHGRSLYGRIWAVLEFMAWRDYLADPRQTTFGIEDFDRFPKGTTCFIAPRALLQEAQAGFESYYDNPREVNDDTALLRPLAARQKFNISPGFSCIYHPRSSGRKFVTHALHRGTVFVDGFGRPGSRFFAAIVAFFPLSIIAVLVAVRRPRLAFGSLLAAPIAAGLFVRVKLRRPMADAAAVTFVGPAWLVAYGLGMWRGASLVLASRLRGAKRPQGS